MKRSLLYNSILKIFSNNFFCVERVKEKLKNEIFIILFVLLNSQFISSQSFGDWQFLGLIGEDVKKMLPHPFDQNTIYAGSAFVGTTSIGGFFVSTNSGITWDTLRTGISVTDFVIDYQNPDIIYLALGGNSPTGSQILKTTDGGNNWFNASNGIFISWEIGLYPIAIDPVNPEILYCGTLGPMGGNFYKTTNGGLNWFPPSVDSSLFYIGVAVIEFDLYNPSLLYVGRAMNGKLFRSTDGGVNFEFAGYENGGGIYSLKFGRNSDEMYTTSSWSFAYPVGIFRTTNSGDSWENLGGAFNGWVGVLDVALKFLEQNYVYIAAFAWEDTSGVYVMINENEWQLIGLEQEFISTLFIKDSLLFAGTNEGIFVKDLITNVNDEEITSQIDNFIIYPIYPNPFNNDVLIKYYLYKPTLVKIEVIDVLGNLVKVLKNNYLYEGEQTIKWNGRDENNNIVASGIYLVKFQVDNQTKVQKIISLK